MNYKTVFQLAQDKGWQPLIIRMDGIHSKLAIAEISLLQKWLRDEHEIQMFVTPIGNNPVKYLIVIPTGYYTNDVKIPPKDTYEQALLEGINEALKLI